MARLTEEDMFYQIFGGGKGVEKCSADDARSSVKTVEENYTERSY